VAWASFGAARTTRNTATGPSGITCAFPTRKPPRFASSCAAGPSTPPTWNSGPSRAGTRTARDCRPEVQRLFAALDQGGGHAHIRHEGWVTEEMNRRRVAYLEDPAQLDPAKRAAGIDGLSSFEKLHRCWKISSRITDPDAFAVAFARGIEQPMVRAALETEFTARQVPRPVSLHVSDLLGPDGTVTARAGAYSLLVTADRYPSHNASGKAPLGQISSRQ